MRGLTVRSNRALWPTPGHGGICGTIQHPVLPSHTPAQEPHPPCQRPSPCEHPRRVSRVIVRLLLLLAVAALLHAPRGRPCHCHRYVVRHLLPVNALILRAPRSACVTTLPMGGEGTKHAARHHEAAFEAAATRQWCLRAGRGVGSVVWILEATGEVDVRRTVISVGAVGDHRSRI
jgi:hypothetical protein